MLVKRSTGRSQLARGSALWQNNMTVSQQRCARVHSPSALPFGGVRSKQLRRTGCSPSWPTLSKKSKRIPDITSYWGQNGSSLRIQRTSKQFYRRTLAIGVSASTVSGKCRAFSDTVSSSTRAWNGNIRERCCGLVSRRSS